MPPHDPYSELEAVRRQYFSQRVLEPKQWFDNANRLTLAMSLIEPSVLSYWEILNKHEGFSEETPEYDCHLIFLMLAGYAIENLCKGFLVTTLSREEATAVKSGKYPRRLATHSIPQLVKWAGLEVDEIERNLLLRIQAAVVWRGRYPVPKSGDEISPFMQNASDVARVNRFLMKLRRQVGAKPSYRVR
jgi:hypothetical protein